MNQGVIGWHPSLVRRKKRRPKKIITPQALPQEELQVEEIVISAEEAPEEVDEVEVVVVEEVKEEPVKKPIKDMTPDQRKAFYKARAEKARLTRERKKLLELTSKSK